MPSIWMRSYRNTLLHRAAVAAVRSQQEYAALKGAADPVPYLSALAADMTLAFGLPMWIAAFITVLISHSLVPDETGAFTSDHGWDLAKDGGRLAPIVAEARSLGVRVSLFMDPIPGAMQEARKLSADRIELYTEPYARAFERGEVAARIAFVPFVECAELAHELGMGVNAGHDLDIANLSLFRTLPHLDEVSIGHALVSDALFEGLDHTVKAYLHALQGIEPA